MIVDKVKHGFWSLLALTRPSIDLQSPYFSETLSTIKGDPIDFWVRVEGQGQTSISNFAHFPLKLDFLLTCNDDTLDMCPWPVDKAHWFKGQTIKSKGQTLSSNFALFPLSKSSIFWPTMMKMMKEEEEDDTCTCIHILLTACGRLLFNFGAKGNGQTYSFNIDS